MKCLAYTLSMLTLASTTVFSQPGPKPSPSDIKANCIAEGKKSGLSAAALDEYVKLCISRNSRDGENPSHPNN